MHLLGAQQELLDPLVKELRVRETRQLIEVRKIIQLLFTSERGERVGDVGPEIEQVAPSAISQTTRRRALYSNVCR